MAERLTERYKDFRCPKCGEVISSASDVEFYQSRLQAQPEIAKALAKLAHYEDLEEQGRLITLPCKIGDTVYGIRRYQDRIVKSGTVSEMFYNQDGELIIAIKNVCRGCWGKQIFGTYEEAEAALKGAEHATRHTDI